MKRVITFGEIMLRLAPEGYYRFVQADTYGATFGGGEANVAVSLANYGMDAEYVTKLPAHAIGQCAVNSLRRYGVDSMVGRTAAVMLGSTETTFYVIGVYFGAAGIRKTRHAVPAALVADFVGFLAAAAAVRWWMH